MKLEGQKVLVTGADGFIGSHLTELLVSNGCSVTALSQYDSFGHNGWLDDLSEDVRASIEIYNKQHLAPSGRGRGSECGKARLCGAAGHRI